MIKNTLKKVMSVVISMQMMCAVVPQFSMTASAEAKYYLSENFSAGLDKWQNSDSAEIKNDEDVAYMSYSSDAESPIVATRSLDTKISSSTEIYVAEVDVRFENENSGVVEFWGGENLGPTIIYDGSKIKTKTGNPDTYVTMYDNAKSGKWYNVKFLTNGRSSMYGYTTDIEAGGASQKTGSSVLRNLRIAQLSKINVTNKVNSEDTVRSGAVDIRNLKVYKALPDKMEISVDGDIEEISVPQTETASTVQYNIESVFFGDIDMTSYDLIKQEIVSFKLYDESNETEVTPKGISIDKS
ncbi:MAG: hypothetical protein IJX57_04640, partial [Clostridia bacterium]|nr:hypothetical protein [Clostridia bacterium]